MCGIAGVIWHDASRPADVAGARLMANALAHRRHYREDPDAFRFASEPWALHAPLARVEPDLDAVHLFVHYGYVPSPRSAFAGARKLAPAHALSWEPGKKARVWRYWQPDYRDKLD